MENKMTELTKEDLIKKYGQPRSYITYYLGNTECTKEEYEVAAGAAISASRPYEIGLNERLKDPVYAAAYAKALSEDGVSASPQPRCPKCGSEKVEFGFSFDWGGMGAYVACFGSCNSDRESVKTLRDFAQFFAPAPAPAPAQEPPPFDKEMLEAVAEDGLLVTWDKDYKFNFSQVVRLMAEFALEHRQ